MVKIHRKGQGRIARNSCLLLLTLIAIFSFQGIHLFTAGYGLAHEKWQLVDVAGRSFYLSHVLGLLTFSVFIFLGVRYIWLKEKTVDFLIDVESEMRKVVWPINPEGRTIGEKTRELRVSSLVVVGVVLFMAYFLYLCDTGLSQLMKMILS